MQYINISRLLYWEIAWLVIKNCNLELQPSMYWRSSNIMDAVITCGVLGPPVLTFLWRETSTHRARWTRPTSPLTQICLRSLSAGVEEGSGALCTNTHTSSSTHWMQHTVIANGLSHYSKADAREWFFSSQVCKVTPKLHVNVCRGWRRHQLCPFTKEE